MPSRAGVSKAIEAEIGGAEGLVGVDAARLDLLLQRFRKGRARDQRALDRGDVAAGRGGGIEQDLQEVRRAAIADRPIGLDQLELRLGIAGAGRDHRAAERARGGIEDEAAGRQMIAEGVEHDVAGTEADGEQRPCAAPGIGLRAFRLEDRAGRGEQPRERAGRGRDEAAEGRRCLVQGRAVPTCAAPAGAPARPGW